MYEYKHERDRREQKLKVYFYAYMLIFLVTQLHSLISGSITIKDALGILFQIFVFFLAKKGHQWGLFVLKFYVWMNILILILMAASFIFT
jgi:hypothetical protein